MKVYFISGVGADERVFQFLDLSFCEPVFLKWLKPFKSETLESYALRLLKLIPEENPVIVGVSFGGMLATEMARANPESKVIIISSNKTHEEFPRHLNIWKHLPVYKSLPKVMLKKLAMKFVFIFKVKGEAQKQVVKDLLKDVDIGFNLWAVEAIFNWTNMVIPKNLTHIHGTSDQILPYKFVKPDYTIKRGTHLMIMNNAKEISMLLKKLIAG